MCLELRLPGEPMYVNAYSGELTVVAMMTLVEVAVALELAKEDRRGEATGCGFWTIRRCVLRR